MFGYDNVSMQIKVPYFANMTEKGTHLYVVYIDCILKLSMIVSVSKLVLEFTTIISH